MSIHPENNQRITYWRGIAFRSDSLYNKNCALRKKMVINPKETVEIFSEKTDINPKEFKPKNALLADQKENGAVAEI